MLFPGVRFALVLSLGADDAGYGSPAPVPDGSQTVFDRLAASAEAVAAILAEDGARLGLRFISTAEGAAVRCAAYGVRCRDAFTRDAEGRIVFSAREVDHARESLSQAMAAFLRACEDADGPVLFLRCETRTAAAGRPDGGAERSGSALDALAAALAQRFPSRDFRLLVAVSAAEAAPGQTGLHDRRIALAALPDEGDAWCSLLGRPCRVEPDAAGDPVVEGSSPKEEGQQAGTETLESMPPPAIPPTEGDAEVTLSGLSARLADGSAAPDLAWRTGREFWRSGRAFQAAEAFALAYAHGCRDLGFLRDHLGLLTGETRYREVIDVIASLRREGFADHPQMARRLDMLVGHARLALAHPREAEIARAAARAISPAWLDLPPLLDTIAAAITGRRPFALIRLGDGEARYLLGETPVETTGLTTEEAQAMGSLVWENWFGAPLSEVDAGRRAELHVALVDAVRTADVIGVSSHERLRADTGHYGYLAWQEAWLRDLTGGEAAQLFTDAQVHHRLNAEAPFLATLLEGQDVLGVISPHPGLADALGRRLGIERVIDHLIPAEGRLPSAAQMREALGPHFPGVYDRLMTSLTIPRPGCVFLVAAGLLGKIYCARIRALGGIALDIGALADAWMGFDTRDGQLAQVARLPTLPSPDPPRARTIACLSMHKTGSTTLTAALRGAGDGDVIHSHRAGPRSIALQRRFSAKPTTWDAGSSLVARFADRDGALALATCVRDPIAQSISMYFQFAASAHRKWGVEPSLAHDDFIVWWEQNIPPDYPTWWFDDNLKATFDIDVRRHPFDHKTKSLRYASERLRLVCLRFEDPASAKEAALGWLVDRDHVALPHVNATASKSIGRAYLEFVASFTAPPRWVETFYETDLIRHFYTEEERAAFRARWSGGPTRRAGPDENTDMRDRSPSTHDERSVRGDPASEVPRSDFAPAIRRTTYGCLSLGKTGSMALTDALRNAGIPDAVHLHFLGPRAIAIKRAKPEPMLDVAIEVAGRIGDPDHAFRFVTAVRDPIARILSQAFYTADRHRMANGGDISRSPEALIAWWEAQAMARYDLWNEWFDDTFRTTFGFDFREHPFDHARKSLRYEADRLRLLVLRQEDDHARREAELGWLLDREGVTLRTVNDAVNQNYEATYRPFLESFVAPSAWLDAYYETPVIRHFYSEAERAAFRARWSDRRTGAGSRAGAAPADRHGWTDPGEASGPVPPSGRTILCLSMMKTGSTAIADALVAANPGGKVAHLHHLGPLGRAGLPDLGRPVEAIAARLGDPRHRFVVATCLRDPIARWISEVFHDASISADPAAADRVADHGAFIAYVESKRMMDYATLWFDDSLRATFGFDFRVHPFDHGRGSLRFVSERLRLLVLRQEDAAASKEAELGWLLGRDRVPLPRRNERSTGALADRYRAFLETFVAPDHWLDIFYETEAARHFYTSEERDMFRKRWGRIRVQAPQSEAAGLLTLDAEASGLVESAGVSVDDETVSSTPQPEDGDAAEQHPSAPHGHTAMEQDLYRVRAELETLRVRLREGRAIDFNDYAYRPRERNWQGNPGAARLRTLFAAGESAYAGLLERFCGFDDRFRAIPVLPVADEPHWENWWLPGLDAVTLYGLVATRAPHTYLEIGSGHSTRFVRRAIQDHGLATRIVSVDPSPTADIEALCDEVVRVRCEEAPASLFASLGAEDMLFFDGGHRSFQNSDATVFFTEILPGLAPGVLYGLHDIFLPYDYPESWTNRFYNEQYLLMAYLLGGAGGDEVVFPAHHVWREPAYAPSRNRLFLGSRHLDWLTSSFWMRRAGASSGAA